MSSPDIIYSPVSPLSSPAYSPANYVPSCILLIVLQLAVRSCMDLTTAAGGGDTVHYDTVSCTHQSCSVHLR